MPNINDYGFPFSSVSGDRQYGASEWRDYFGVLFSNGIIDGEGNNLQVNPQTVANKTVYVDTGAMIVNGVVRVVVASENLTIADNVSGSDRIDRIVARLNYTDRKIEFAVLEGTPSGSPVAPSLTRSSSVWELSLAKIDVANGFSVITETEITWEQYDESVCGLAKTMYMQQFDDENNLLKYNRDVVVVDGSGNPTEVQYKRPIDSSLFLKVNYTNPDGSGRYQTITELYYQSDGVTVYKTIVYTVAYLTNGLIDTMTRVVS